MYKLLEKNCVYCNITFLGSKHRKYCGYKCSKNARKKRVNLICQSCNKEFEVQEWSKNSKYCSKKCKVKSQSSDIINITCDYCNNEFKRKEFRTKMGKHNFCSKDCSNKFNTGSNHYEWKEYLHDKNIKLALKQWSLKIKERDCYTCQLCGETNKNILESHHMKHRSTFPELQFDFNNGITLCLSCHALQHVNDPKALRLINHKMAKNR